LKALAFETDFDRGRCRHLQLKPQRKGLTGASTLL
jgi:hypothetical protein